MHRTDFSLAIIISLSKSKVVLDFFCIFDVEERGWWSVSFSELLQIFPLGSRVFFKDVFMLLYIHV